MKTCFAFNPHQILAPGLWKATATHEQQRSTFLCSIFSDRLYFMQPEMVTMNRPLPTKPSLAPCLVRAYVHQKIHEQDAVLARFSTRN